MVSALGYVGLGHKLDMDDRPWFSILQLTGF